MTNSNANVDDRQLDALLSQLESARPWSPRLVSKLETFVRSASDLELFRINPFQFAAERGSSEAETLDLFLHGTKLGLFEMDWHVVCPHCGFVVDSMHAMNQLRSHYVCPTCASERDYALDDYIQVAFSISSRVRDTAYHHPESLAVEDLFLNYRLSKDVLCPIPAYPSWREAIIHVTTFLRYLEPNERVATELALPAGVLRATDGRNCLQLSITRAPHEPVSNISLSFVGGKLQSNDPELQPRSLNLPAADGSVVPFRFELERQLPNGKLLLELENLQERRTSVCIYQLGEMPTPVLSLRPSLSGRRLLTTQTFKDLFRSELVNENETLSLKDITFLFTDLKGSTAMYEQVGDAKAYFLVHQHFHALTRVIRERGGAVVKTIGDAVMAVFESPVNATAAALEMIDALHALNQTISERLALKLGIHRGPSMVVTVNEHVDYFGQTVNIAARVQGLADADELYLTAEVHDSPGVAQTLQAHHVAVDEVLVKGVSERIRVHKVARSY